MIVHLEGIVLEATPLSAVLDVQGIGYEVHVPVTTAERLPGVGQKAKLHTLAVYREDSQALYGFATREDRDFFRLLTEKVSGIGPKIALSIMSKLSVPMLRSAIASSDVALLSKCPGIGKKTAERLCIELRDHVGTFLATQEAPSVSGASGAPVARVGESRIQDAVMALIALGYKADVADKAVRKADQSLGPEASIEALIKAALR
jgi:Holliday junction DNA helicase RuvA